MKAVIIENESSVPRPLQGFIKDNPDLFDSVDEQLFCLQRPMDDVAPSIAKADAVIIESTWQYKEQLEDFVKAFVNKAFGKDYKFYIMRFTRDLNKWNEKDETGDYSFRARMNFDDHEEFIASVKKLVSEQEVYTISQNWNEKQVYDELHTWSSYKEMDRYPYQALRISYDKKMDVFHDETETPKEAKKRYKQ